MGGTLEGDWKSSHVFIFSLLSVVTLVLFYSYCKEFGSNYSCITLGSIRHCECRLDFNPLSKNKNC